MTPLDSTATHPICTAPSESLVVTCYVRPAVSTASRRQVEHVQTRLRDLQETDLVDTVRVRHWPPQQHAADTDAATTETRETVLTTFEAWADEQGYSLAPAVRRRTVPSVLHRSADPTVEVCLPVLLLALRAPETAPAQLRGVVPYTVNPGTEDARTYTVDDWLTAAEAATRAGDQGEVAVSASHSRPVESTRRRH